MLTCSHNSSEFIRDILLNLPDPVDYPPVCYDEHIDQLLVFFNRSNGRSVVEVEILPRTWVLFLNDPEEHRDSLAGLQIGPGVQAIVRCMYQTLYGDHFEANRITHNAKRVQTTVASILKEIRLHHPPLEDVSKYFPHIEHLLATHDNLTIHIPLLEQKGN